MGAEAFILDGYVDEPACLGVPPYISPYIRTVAGVLVEHGYSVRYLTIDQLRTDPRHINDLIAVYQELASEYDITLPTIAESAGESLN